MEYIVEKFELTSNPQTILFPSLTDIRGRSLPTAFSVVPYVKGNEFYGKRKIKITSITTSQFKVTLSKSGRIGLSAYYINLKIIGDV